MELQDKENLPAPDQSVFSLTQEKQSLEAMEESLKVLQSRIHYLLKQDEKNRKKLNDAFQGSLKTIDKKLQQAQSVRKLKTIQRKKQQQTMSIQNRVKEMREKQHQEIIAVKECLGEIKREERDNIKEMSKRNKQVIAQHRENEIVKKKEAIKQIKEEKERMKQTYMKYLEEKKQELEALREEERKKAITQKKRLADKLKEMENTEKELVERIKHTTRSAEQFNLISQHAHKMEVGEFEKIVYQAKREVLQTTGELDQTKLKEVVLEKIINGVSGNNGADLTTTNKEIGARETLRTSTSEKKLVNPSILQKGGIKYNQVETVEPEEPKPSEKKCDIVEEEAKKIESV